ncbi:MAG: methionyl-tRNA formyltransferase [Acetobacteraceae bacterium]
MRLAFMGSPEFAIPALEALLAAGHEIAIVYTQPPRPAGRGGRMRPSPVASRAASLGLPLATPERLKANRGEWACFAAFGLDATVVAAYGLILPPEMLSAPKRGSLNIHASLLPRWRGAAPVQAAIRAGDALSGVSIMQMDAGLDTGPILLQEAIPISPAATAGTFTAALGTLGARLIVRALAENPEPRPQPADGVTYAPRLARADGRLDWSHSATALARQVRAFDPWPGSFCELEDAPLKVLEAEQAPGEGRTMGPPGTLLDTTFRIACGSGALRLLAVQPAGKARMSGAAFLNGHRLAPGTRLR